MAPVPNTYRALRNCLVTLCFPSATFIAGLARGWQDKVKVVHLVTLGSGALTGSGDCPASMSIQTKFMGGHGLEERVTTQKPEVLKLESDMILAYKQSLASRGPRCTSNFNNLISETHAQYLTRTTEYRCLFSFFTSGSRCYC